MKKTLITLLFLIVLIPLTLAVAEEGLLYSGECGCSEVWDVANKSWYEWDAIGASGHVLRRIDETYCAVCDELLAKWHMVLTDIESHEYNGYECTICGYWQLGTATMYEEGAGSDLQYATIGSIVTFGAYEQDGLYSNGSEPIEWIVLDRRGDRVLLLSRYGLDAYPYHQKSSAVNWSSSSVRTWLHDVFFYEAFSAEEQGKIVTTHNSTPVNSNNSGSPGPDTYDKVFFLSSAEATAYLSTRESRMVKATSYALMRGAETNYSQNSYWWLRSYADTSRRKVLMINSQGNVYASDPKDYGAVIRPAIWITVE